MRSSVLFKVTIPILLTSMSTAGCHKYYLTRQDYGKLSRQQQRCEAPFLVKDVDGNEIRRLSPKGCFSTGGDLVWDSDREMYRAYAFNGWFMVGLLGGLATFGGMLWIGIEQESDAVMWTGLGLGLAMAVILPLVTRDNKVVEPYFPDKKGVPPKFGNYIPIMDSQKRYFSRDKGGRLLGMVAYDVFPDSKAERYGLKEGDLVIEYDGNRVGLDFSKIKGKLVGFETRDDLSKGDVMIVVIREKKKMRLQVPRGLLGFRIVDYPVRVESN